MPKNAPLPLQIRVGEDQRHRIFPFGSSSSISTLGHRVHLFLAFASGSEDAVLGSEQLTNERDVSAPVVAVVCDENGRDFRFGKVVFLIGQCDQRLVQV